MAAHEPQWDENDGGRCQVCGQRYHCPACNEGSSMMAHGRKDEKGWYDTCQEPERYQAGIIRARAETEIKERAELRRLKAKYEDE